MLIGAVSPIGPAPDMALITRHPTEEVLVLGQDDRPSFLHLPLDNPKAATPSTLDLGAEFME